MQITNPRRFIVFLLIVVILVAVSLMWLSTISAKVKHSFDITIESGTSAQRVWQDLADVSITSTTWPWRFWSWHLQAASRLKAGAYHLEEGERVRDVINRLIAGDINPDELTVTFPEGFTLEQMGERLAARGFGTKEDFLAAAKPKDFVSDFPLLENIPAGRDLEGYLFPDTYRLSENDSAADIVERLAANFHRRLTPDMRDEVAKSGRSLDDIVIMASIVEREVQGDDDMALVSGILWKRVDDGVGLDADATIRYAADKWDGPLTVQDLQTDSPYNTRKWRGLPPGPISNPGLRALQAALHPQTSDYYYYLSTPAGQTIFSKTLEEHNANKAKYLR